MKKRITKNLLITALFLLGIVSLGWSQAQTPLDAALRYIEQNYESMGLTKMDVTDMSVSHQFTSKNNGVTHIYLMQRHAETEIYNAILTVNVLPSGEILHIGNNLVADAGAMIEATTPILSAYNAIEAAASHLDIAIATPLNRKETEGTKFFIYEGGSVSNSDISVKLRYQPVREINAKGVASEVQSIRLAWDLAIDMKNSSDYWSLRVDALTGKVLDQNNYTVYCTFENDRNHRHGTACQDNKVHQSVQQVLEDNTMFFDSAMYHVFAWPLESPIHGERTIELNPHNPEFSPFGWHDTNGQEGPEFTITRGNNVHAFLDLDDSNASMGDEPDGGEALHFDYPYDPLTEPTAYRDFAVTQLFYSNNMIHDWSANYGFDEAAGNFQQRNYSGLSGAGDPVRANAQDGFNIPLLNNATFGTPPDGSSGTMSMYVWNAQGGGALTVNEPAAIAGIYQTGTANFGASITSVPVTAEVVIADDGSSSPSMNCEPTINDLTGKIALIDRTLCEFGLKILNAENAGAIGAIICNFDGGSPVATMGAGAVGGQVTIPSVFISFADCQLIRQAAGNGLEVSLVIPDNSGPVQHDGDLDNGIVAHEFGHGISNRLTGGATNTGCLGNDEQMGEGWSDFFTLVTTVKPGDVGETGRGIGTYVLGQETNGLGIRRQRYSTDMSVNTQTYNDIIGTAAPHPLGEVWTVTLWDLYWRLVDEYGFDEDITNAGAGNNIAVQLVMDGMKMQSCNPGFIAGRDGILAADVANNEGVNQCLIWEVFARRGIGFDADGGSEFNRHDLVEGFNIKPECTKEIYVTKAVTDFIQPGEDIEVTIFVANYNEEMRTGVVVTDEIPETTSYMEGSASAEATVTGNMIAFDLGDLPSGAEMTITYSLSTLAENGSIRQFIDDVEADDEKFFPLQIDPEQVDVWDISDDLASSGEQAWFVPNTERENDQVLVSAEPFLISGDQPVFTWQHFYSTEWGADGGYVEVSTDNASWDLLPEDKVFRNGYNATILYFNAIPNLPIFFGVSDESFNFEPVYIDMSEYVGQELYIRFRFLSDDNTPGVGWYVDDIEMIDMLNYNGEVCVAYAEGADVCAIADSRGTIVASAEMVNTEDIAETNIGLSVQPNPAQDFINVNLVQDRTEIVTINILTVDGKEVMSQEANTYQGQQTISMNVSTLAKGFYFVQVTTERGIVTEKIVIE